MKVLFVTPVEQGSGETITALHVATRLVARGHSVRFLATPFARRFLDGAFHQQIQDLGADSAGNCALWNAALREFRPDVVVFADYPMLFFRFGVAPLATVPGWVESLEDIDACLVTLDHFGFAQRAMGFYMGPPHLTFQYQWFPPIPDRMQIILPCPMHEPGPVEGRRGEPFRCWDVPISIPDAVRREIRHRYLAQEDDLLVFHSVPNWAWRAAEAFGLSFYRFLPRLFEEYFGHLPKPVTIVSVNNGGLLVPPVGAQVRVLNLSPIPTPDFEGLLLSADLVITENRVSISMGKAICGTQACAVLKNSHRLLPLLEGASETVRDVVLAMENARPGTVYPYDVFPNGMAQELEELVLYRSNSLTRAFRDAEVFGGDATADALGRLLTDPGTREKLRADQMVYVDRLRALNDGAQVLEKLVQCDRGGDVE